ncbi:hypothetical protein B7494_g14 [Chlorociboria aeruginascens]|nr:hypothetical protein B7494_g14 [Chlorociboria aeruginascens]
MPVFFGPPVPYGFRSQLTETRRPSQPAMATSISNIMFKNAVFYPNYRVYRGETPASLNYDCISHVFYAFANVGSDGSVFLSDEWADTQMSVDGASGCLGSLMQIKKQHEHLQVILSIGGGSGSQNFAAVASTAAARDNFGKSAKGLVEASGFDGVDIDWEHPEDPQQGKDFLSLLAAIRLYLPDNSYLLTASLPAGQWALQNIDLCKAQEYLDFINLMAYDFTGPWTPQAGNQAQLYAGTASEPSGSAAVDYTIFSGFPASQVLLGIPVYGRSFLGATKPGDTYTGQGGEDGTFEYKELPRPGTQELVDTRLVAASCVGGDGGFVSYDNAETVALKAIYCKEKGLGKVNSTNMDEMMVHFVSIVGYRQGWNSPTDAHERQGSKHIWTTSLSPSNILGQELSIYHALLSYQFITCPNIKSTSIMNGTSTAPSLDAADYDPIAHLNTIFSHPSTLTSVAETATALQTHQNDLSTSISSLVATQAYNDDSSLQRMQSAKTELALLFRKIESVRTRAIETEQKITSMTADIKRLDGTKRNLTLSMTALKRLQMLTTAYEQLRGLAKSRQYRECASLLSAVLQLMKHFNSYRSIDQIATLSRNVAELQRELLEQVCEDFEISFAKGEVGVKKGVLGEACLVMDALGENARARLVTWYVNTQLREYRQVFRGNDEAGSLDNIGRRYSWFRRMLKTYEDEHAAIFPIGWRVNEVLANAFCEGTRDDFKGILERSTRRPDGAKIDVNLLLSCLQETMDFEHSLEKRFASEPRESIDTLSSMEEKPQTFGRSISEAFEPYLSPWVDSQDRQLATMIPKYRSQPLLPPDEEFSSQAVIASSIELFHLYKITLAQCAKLSTSERLLDLSRILAKYLDEYAQQVLLYFLQAPALSLQNTILVLNTADYWHTNTQQLEDNLKKRIDSELAPKVDLSSQSDTFMGIASAAVLALVHRVEINCESSWREMRNTNWSKMETAGDQSSYVAELLSHINTQAEEILALVGKQQYARAFCDNVVEYLANTYIANIVQCRPISEVGAEQMLLDKYVLTKGLTNLLSYSPSFSSTNHQPPVSFTKRVNHLMARLDPLLKTLQVRPSPPEVLVQAYLIHIGDRSDTNFRKILELKGVRKIDHASLVELFGVHREGKANEQLVQSSPLLTPLMQTGSLGIAGLGMGTNLNAAGAGLPTRFDPAGFGEKLFSVARDGVERMGTGAGVGTGGAGPVDRIAMAASPLSEDAKATVEGNLKSIGKFFRRDMSGFGRFGGRRDGSGVVDDTVR